MPWPMSRYRPRFEALIEALRSHPCLEVVEAELGAPLGAGRVAEMVRAAGIELPAAGQELYGEMDGAKIFWRVRADLSDDAWHAYLDADPNGWYIEPGRTHGLLIGRLEEVLGFTHWPREFPVLAGDEAVARQIYPFDFYLRRGNEDACMALVLGEAPEQARVVMLTSSGCYDPRLASTDMGSYLELVIASRGEISMRQQFEQAGGCAPLDGEELATLGRQLFRLPVMP